MGSDKDDANIKKAAVDYWRKDINEKPYSYLYLPDVKTLSTKSAKTIARFKGDRLSLNDLANIDKHTAKELTTFNGFGLSLDSMETIEWDR